MLNCGLERKKLLPSSSLIRIDPLELKQMEHVKSFEELYEIRRDLGKCAMSSDHVLLWISLTLMYGRTEEHFPPSKRFNTGKQAKCTLQKSSKKRW